MPYKVMNELLVPELRNCPDFRFGMKRKHFHLNMSARFRAGHSGLTDANLGNVFCFAKAIMGYGKGFMMAQPEIRRASMGTMCAVGGRVARSVRQIERAERTGWPRG